MANPRRRLRKTKREQNQEIIADYIRETGANEWDHHDIAKWAIEKGRWHRTKMTLEQICAKELSQAAREEYFTDEQGRRVRRKHVRRVTDADGQKTFIWADIVNAPPDHMKLSLQQRRRGSLGDLKQLKTDQDSYNDNNKFGAQINLSFDFTEDLAELDLPTDYPGLSGDEEPDGDD